MPKAKFPKEPCDICGELFFPSRIAIHKSLKHGKEIKAQLADVTTKLAQAESQIKELSNHAALSDNPQYKNAVLADWINGITIEAWEAIGKEHGFIADMPAAETPAAELSDTPLTPPDPLPAESASLEEPNSTLPVEIVSPRKVLLAQHGVVVTLEDHGIYFSHINPGSQAVIAFGKTQKESEDLLKAWYEDYFGKEQMPFSKAKVSYGVKSQKVITGKVFGVRNGEISKIYGV